MEKKYNTNRLVLKTLGALSNEVGLGYITESMTKALDIIFNEYKLHRIEATVIPNNKSSLRVLEKLNFKHEGICEKYQKINGKWEDHILLALLNENLQE